jgi:hypothetical protein
MAASSKSASQLVARSGVDAASRLSRLLTDPKKTKRLMNVSKVVAPILAPIALKAVDLARAAADAQRARALGVDVSKVADYRGPTGRSKARIDALTKAVEELLERRTGDADIVAFANRTRNALVDLRIAVETAAPMPAARRRPTIDAVRRELDRLEAQLLDRLTTTGLISP